MEAGELLEVRKVWVTNMLLLGFDTTSSEDMFKVALEKDMFAHINKKGSEVVMHFLFTRLDSHVAQQEFRYKEENSKPSCTIFFLIFRNIRVKFIYSSNVHVPI